MKYLTLLLLLGLISSIVAAPSRGGKGKYVQRVEEDDESAESDEADDISAEEFGRGGAPPNPPPNFVRPAPQVTGPVYTASPNLLGRFNWASLWGNKNKQQWDNQGPTPTKQFRQFRDDDSDEEEEEDEEDFDDIENDMYAEDNDEVNSDLEYSPPESPPNTDETSSFRSHPFFVSSGRSRSSSSPQVMRVRRVTPIPTSYSRMPVRMSSQPMYQYQYQRRPSMNTMPYRRVQSPMTVPMYPVRRTTPMRMPMMMTRRQQVPVMYYKMRPSSSAMKTQMPMQYYAVRQRRTRN